MEIQIAAGPSHALAIKNDGTLWSWGNNKYGQQGSYPLDNKLRPQQIGGDADWRKVAAGTTVSCAVKQDGSLYIWGDNSYGQLATGGLPGGSNPNPVKKEGVRIR